jgi:phosphomannomutase
VTNKALLTNEAQVGIIKKYLEQDIDIEHKENTNIEPEQFDLPNFTKEHTDAILLNINVTAIRDRKFKVVADMINASACVVDPYLFEQLNAELIALNNVPNGKFAHRPEPAVENLEDIGRLVKEVGADIGFAHDPDADRVVFVDENGKVISEDYTLAFGVENILSKNPGENVVMNLSSSSMVSDIVEKYSGKCFRTKVGESNVLEGIQKQNAIIGGEGTSGVIYPAINTSRDGFVSLSLALELLAERLKTHFSLAQINEVDGLRLDFNDKSWIHLRPSITEPIIRLFGEAKTEERVNTLFNEAKSILSLVTE